MAKKNHTIPKDLSIPAFLKATGPGTPPTFAKRVEFDGITSSTHRFALTEADKKAIAELRAQEDRRSEEAKAARLEKRLARLAELKANAGPTVGAIRRAKRAGMVDMKVIAAELNMIPREARAALRTA